MRREGAEEACAEISSASSYLIFDRVNPKKLQIKVNSIVPPNRNRYILKYIPIFRIITVFLLLSALLPFAMLVFVSLVCSEGKSNSLD